MKKRIVVVENNPEDRKQIVELIENVYGKTDIVVASNILEGYKCIWKEEVSLLITSIELGEKSFPEYPGVRLIRQIRKYAGYQFLPIIVVTESESLKSYMYQEMNCFGYFLKPLDEESFKNTVEQALRHEDRPEEEKVFAVRKHNVYHMVRVDDVMYVESYDRMLHIHLINETVLEVSQKPIQYILNAADSKNLVRCAKGALINKKHMIGYSSDMQSILLTNGIMVKTGRKYVGKIKEVAKQIQEYNKNNARSVNNKYRMSMNKIL